MMQIGFWIECSKTIVPSFMSSLTFNPINFQTYCIVEWFKKPLSFRLIKILRQIVEFYMQLTNTCQILSEI
jgi:hypothetical protein